MQVPLQVVFEHIGSSDVLETAVRKEAERLERFFDRITSMRVVIARPQHRHHKGDAYCVRIHIAVPAGKHIDITRDPAATGRHEDAHVTIRDAFDAAGRQLQDYVRKLEGQVKTHEPPPHGIIASIFPDQGYGFISSADGREVYFHRNSVVDDRFDDLKVGQEVRFSEAEGIKGAQATFVRPVGKHHVV